MFVKFNDRRSTAINMSLVRSFNKADEPSPFNLLDFNLLDTNKPEFIHEIVIHYTDGEIDTLSYANMIERDSDYSEKIRTVNWLFNNAKNE